eukprot:c19478_g1_i1 orf=617-1129(-)
MTAVQAGQYRPPISVPVLHPPTFPVPGSVPGAIRPPILPRPALPSPGYGPPPMVDMNGLSRPLLSSLTPPGAPGVRPPMSFPTPSPNTSMPSGPPGTSLSNGLYANFAPSSGASMVSYTPQGSGASVNEMQYSSQQAFRPMGPPGSSGLSSSGYSQGTSLANQSIANYGS